MFGILIRLLVLIAAGGFGWVMGSVYPAPDQLIALVNPQAIEQRAEGISSLGWQRLRDILPKADRDALTQDAVRTAAAAGTVITVERVTAADMSAETPDIPGAATTPAANADKPATQMAFDTALLLCPRMTISNSPGADATGHVRAFKPIVMADGVRLATYPTHDACLSSGFGQRSGHMHKGVDYYSPDGGQILAAAEGTIIELKYRDDYGNMLLIDHGHGVYTRYAHLASFRSGLAVGQHVDAGEVLGLMGNTASYRVPVHLHYEVLLGDYANPRGSFGLTPRDPFSFPAAS